VNQNIDTGTSAQMLSVRQRLEQHRMMGAGCAACHSIMDQIGLGLENFDAVGRYRTSDAFGAIDATGQLPMNNTTVNFNGATQLAGILSADPRLVPCVVTNMLTFSIGRDFSHDTGLRDAIVTTAGGNAATLKATLETVVMSDAFRSRRAALATEVMP
jgi:hypothetical protein